MANTRDLFDLIGNAHSPETGAVTGNAPALVSPEAVQEVAALSAASPASPPPPSGDAAPDSGEPPEPPLAGYAARAYLAYAMSVVTGRAIPALADGQKPVQRRILYAMRDMGLQRSPKHVKSARVVGEVIGKWHPHGDTSVYDAMVRMAQHFTLRYPVVDGQGNFGSLDGDSAAAMRYTEANLTPISELLLAEMDEGTVDFRSNYDGTLEEPVTLPARLPFLLMNGASGIAVGMATEIPPHNLRELAQVCAELVLRPDMADDEILQQIPGPDFPGGGQIISTPGQIREAYLSGRGSIRVRARWEVEKLARGEWRIAVQQLPPGVSTAQILSEIETLSNPQAKGEGKKKALTPEQQTTKNAMLSQMDTVRDESGKAHAVRIVIEPRSRNQDPQSLMTYLLARTSLESNQSVNLTVLDLDGKAPCMPLTRILRQWVRYRVTTVRRRSQFRLDKALARIHILEGRLRVLLDIDAVIRVIRESDDPKADLMTHFDLSEMQAEDILEIRLRQLARLAGIELEKELADKRETAAYLSALLQDESRLRALIAEEITADAKKFGDDRRTLLEADTAITNKSIQTIAAAVTDEPVTVIVSQKGWLRTRSGHGLDTTALGFKEGDALLQAFEVRSVDTLALLDNSGRAYSIAVAQIPGGRGDGIPVSSQVDFQPGGALASVACGASDSLWLVAGTGGYGFLTTLEKLTGRNRAGKVFLILSADERPLPLVPVTDLQAETLCLSSDGYGLLFPLAEVKNLPKGKGVKLIALSAPATLQFLSVYLEGQPLPRGLRKNRVDACRGRRGGRGRAAR